MPNRRSAVADSQPEAVNQKSILYRPKEEIVISWIQGCGTLLVSAVLGVLTWNQTRIAQGVQQHEVMASYLAQMSEFLLERNLRTSKPTDDVRTAASSITLNAVRRLDAERKGQLLKFLYDANLIGSCPAAPLDPKVTETIRCSPAVLQLNGAMLQQLRFERSLNLAGITLSGMDLSDSDLQNMGLPKAVAKGATLEHTKLNRAVLNNADFTSARLQQADLTAAQLTRANLSNALLDKANFSQAILVGSNLKGAFLVGATLAQSRLDSANLTYAALLDADLSGASLVDADLRCAALQGAKLTGAALNRALLTGAQYDQTTEFPATFDKNLHAMVQVERDQRSQRPPCAIQ
ncbi:MAG: pentapeptide repeat-containing protein [Elainella sp.]